jgi:hypothetical protein
MLNARLGVVVELVVVEVVGVVEVVVDRVPVKIPVWIWQMLKLH